VVRQTVAKHEKEPNSLEFLFQEMQLNLGGLGNVWRINQEGGRLNTPE